MKKFTKLLSLILIFVLAMGVTACSSCENESSYDKLTKAITELGYNIEQNSKEASNYKDDDIVNVYVFAKKYNLGESYITARVIVLEIDSVDDVDDVYEDLDIPATVKNLIHEIIHGSETKSVYDNLKKAGAAYDNFLIINKGLEQGVNRAIINLNK